MNLGRRIFGLGAAAMGATAVAFHALGPAPPSPSDALAFTEAAILILGGLAVNLPRVSAGGAMLLAAYFAISAAWLAGPPVVARPQVLGNWEDLAERVALCVGGGVAYALTPGLTALRFNAISRGGRLLFSLCLMVFGAAHFAYAAYTASLVPAWLPPGQMAWAYITGVAQILAGVALLTHVNARLAAILLTILYALFAGLVHAPLAHAAPQTRFYWDELFETVALMGVAWSMADAIGRSPEPR